MTNRTLIICPTGIPVPENSASWRAGCMLTREYDIALLVYRPFQMLNESPDYIFRGTGSKWELIKDFLKTIPDIASKYDFVGFVDDDLEFTQADITTALHMAKNNGFDIFQLSVTSDSDCSYSILT